MRGREDGVEEKRRERERRGSRGEVRGREEEEEGRRAEREKRVKKREERREDGCRNN